MPDTLVVCRVANMTKGIISRAEFSRRCGVNQSMITRACAKKLKKAVVGKRIDASHPDAEAYLKRQELAHTQPVAEGLDPLYEKAIELCRITGRWNHTSLRKPLAVGAERALRIFKTMEAAGVIPSPEDQTPSTVTEPPVEKPVVKGYAARNTTKKQASLDALNSGGVIHDIPEDIRDFADMTLRELIQRFGTDVAFLDWLNATKRIEDINEKRLKNAATQGDLVSRQLVKTGIIDPIESAHLKLLTDGSKTIARRVTAMHSAGRDLADIENFVSDQISSFIRPMKAKIKRSLKNA